MKKLLLIALVVSSVGTLVADEPIPSLWRNTPLFGRVYEVIKTVPAGPNGKDIPVGTKVLVSRRTVEDLLRRDEKRVGLLIVGQRNEDDPGITDGYIPLLAISEYLRTTNAVGPLAHWESHEEKFADKEIPNLKPNHYFQSSFVMNAYPARPYKKERPVLLGHALIVRMIKPSPHCLDSEVTIRLREPKKDEWYLKEIREKNPSLAIAGPWYGTDYCVSFQDFLLNFSPNGGEITEALPDAMTWDEAIEHYHTKFVLKQMQAAVVKVSPYSAEDLKEGRMSPNIRVTPVKSLPKSDHGDLPIDGWIAEYSGPLYYSCAGGVCRAQGYRIVLDGDGKITGFQKNNLYSWNGHVELPLDKDDEKRLIELCNDAKMLEELHAFAKSESGESYAAKMSGLSAAKKIGRSSGNTYGTFVVHLSKIREKLGFKERWPIYDGKAPKSSGVRTGLR